MVRKIFMMFLLASLPVILLSCAVVPNIVTSVNNSEDTTNKDEISISETTVIKVRALAAPAMWYFISQNIPYTIIHIQEITDERIDIFHSVNSIEYTKINCSVLYSHSTNTAGLLPAIDISEDGSVLSLDGSGTTDMTLFDDITEIYMPTQFISKINENDTVMIDVTKRNINGNTYYIPKVDYEDENNVELFMLNDNKIIIDEKSMKQNLYWSINEFNSGIDDIRKYSGNDTVMLFRNGMTIEEIEDFFDIVYTAGKNIKKWADENNIGGY